MAEPGTGPLLVDPGSGGPAADRDTVSRWLGTVALLQGAYGRLLRRTVPRVSDPLVRDWLAGVGESAREHERAVTDLYAAFDLPEPGPQPLRVAAGFLLAGTKRVVGRLEGRLAGASSGVWRDLRELQLANLDAMSAFAVVEQLGLAQGRPHVVEIVFGVVTKKSEQQLLLQELFLEHSTDALRGRS